MSSSTAASQQALCRVPTPEPHNRSFVHKVGDCFKNMFLCCTGAQDVDDIQGERVRCRSRGGMQISSPTNFRREEINIPGMTPSQERFIREKARSDAERMFSQLRPLASSPSSQFVERPPHATTGSMPSYEHFVQPRVAPSPIVGGGQQNGKLDRMIAHTRKISGGFRKTSLSGGGDGGGGHGKGEMETRALMDPSRMQVPPSKEHSPALRVKLSEESWESQDRDSAKGGMDAKL